MTLVNWLANCWLVEHITNAREIEDLSEVIHPQPSRVRRIGPVRASVDAHAVTSEPAHGLSTARPNTAVRLTLRVTILEFAP